MSRNLAAAFKGLGLLAADEPLRVRVWGDCMAPGVKAGAEVFVAPARVYWPGDVVAFRTPDGRLLLHRVLGWRPGKVNDQLTWHPRKLTWHLVTEADAAHEPDRPVALADVLGRLRGGECAPSLVTVPFRRRLRSFLRYLSLAAAFLRRSRWMS